MCVKRTSVNDVHLLSLMGRKEDMSVSILKYFFTCGCKKTRNIEPEDIACSLKRAEQNCVTLSLRKKVETKPASVVGKKYS